MQTIRITTSQNIDIDYEIAGLGERIFGRLIDLAISIPLVLAFWIITNSFKIDTTIFFIIGMLVLFFYDLVCEAAFNGQSIGKRVMKIKVISLDGGQPTLSQYLMRWIFRIVDFSLSMQLGALIAVSVTEKHQRIGDLVAGTTLVRTHARTNINDIAFTPVDANYISVFPQAQQLKNAEVALIHEVVKNVKRSDNYTLLHNTAVRFKQHLNIESPKGMDDLTFLQTLVKDYNFAAASTEV